MKTLASGPTSMRFFKVTLVSAIALLCIGIVLSAYCAYSAFAENPTQTVVDTQGNELEVPTSTVQDQTLANDEDAGLSPADNCSITLNYYEMVMFDDPDVPKDENGLRLMGTRTLSGFHEGQELTAWSYVVDIPGYFFWDGWPNRMVVSRDPSQNVYTLNYVRLWNSEYTVNYYLMTGADLTADSWSGALAPQDVEFTKLGSETFTNQRFDKLIVGDAYEYKIDDTYVIDTYPAQIRLGTDPDNNVINVLYTPSSTTLPDGIEIPDGIFDYNDQITTLPDAVEVPDGDVNYDDQITTLPDAVEIPDQIFDHDDLITTLPDDVIVEDFVGNGNDDAPGNGEAVDDTVEITDEMLENPVNKKDAEETINAYTTGTEKTMTLVETGDRTIAIVGTLAGIAFLAAVVFAVLAWRGRKRMAEASSDSE